jgi:hypothetical protein
MSFFAVAMNEGNDPRNLAAFNIALQGAVQPAQAFR